MLSIIHCRQTQAVDKRYVSFIIHCRQTQAVDKRYVSFIIPVSYTHLLDTQVDAPLWETYGDYNAREEMQKEFCDRLAAKVGI